MKSNKKLSIMIITLCLLMSAALQIDLSLIKLNAKESIEMSATEAHLYNKPDQPDKSEIRFSSGSSVPGISADVDIGKILTVEERKKNMDIILYGKDATGALTEEENAAVIALLEGEKIGYSVEFTLKKETGETIPKVEDPILITIDIPLRLRESTEVNKVRDEEKTITRVFSSVIINGSKAERFEDLDNSPDTVTFEMREFSKVAFVYIDVEEKVIESDENFLIPGYKDDNYKQGGEGSVINNQNKKNKLAGCVGSMTGGLAVFTVMAAGVIVLRKKK